MEQIFEKTDNLVKGADYWERLAHEAEQNKQHALAIKYYKNVINTALGVGRAQRARDSIARLSTK